MSAKAPLGRPRRKTGSEDAVCTSAISVGDEVREVMSQAAATSVIHTQMFDAIHTAFASAALQYPPATNGVILNSSVPIMIIFVGWLIYRDTITRMQALGVTISLTGVLVVLTRGDLSVLASLSLNKGDLIVFARMIFWAGDTVF